MCILYINTSYIRIFGAKNQVANTVGPHRQKKVYIMKVSCRVCFCMYIRNLYKTHSLLVVIYGA